MEIKAFVLLNNFESKKLLKEITENKDFSTNTLPETSQVNLTLSDFPTTREIIVSVKRLEAKMIALRHEEFCRCGDVEKIEYIFVFLNTEHRLIDTQRIRASVLMNNNFEKWKIDNLYFPYVACHLQNIILKTLKNFEKKHQ